MKTVFEKIIERLKELGWGFAEYYPDGTEINKRTRKSVAYDDVVEIVNQVIEEYGKDINVHSNDGWIPCSERLPNQSGVYQVTLKSEIVDCAYFDGQNTWHNDNRVNHSRNYLTNVVVAWMPKPEPYQPKGERR